MPVQRAADKDRRPPRGPDGTPVILARRKAQHRGGRKHGMAGANKLDCLVKKTERKGKAAVRSLDKALTTLPLVRARCERPQYSMASAAWLPPQSRFINKG